MTQIPASSVGSRSAVRNLTVRIKRYDPERDATPALAGVQDRRRPDGPRPRRAPERQVESGRVAGLAAFVRTWRLRLRRDADQRRQRPGLQDPGQEPARATSLTIEPILGLPVIKDLIVDMKPFFDHYKSVMPFLVNDEPPPTTERLQSPERARAIRRHDQVHPLCLLHDGLPAVLGRPEIRRPGGDRQRPPLHLRLARPRGRRPPGHPQRCRGRLAVPDGLQLHQRLPARHPGHQGHPGSQARDADRKPGRRTSFQDDWWRRWPMTFRHGLVD